MQLFIFSFQNVSRQNIQCCTCECEPKVVEMTINEIINGSEEFPGICKLIRAYLSHGVSFSNS